jgi:hypothetical protein
MNKMSFTKPEFSWSMPMATLLGIGIIFFIYVPRTHGICDTNLAFKTGAESHVIVRRSQRRGAKNKAEILWDPKAVLIDPTMFKVAAAHLEMRQDDQNSWNIAMVDTKNHGRNIKWSVKVKPCKKYHFRIKVTENNAISMKSCLPITETLNSLSKEDIKQSGYIPDTPKAFVADVNYTYGELKWEVSDCAESYEVKYIAAGDE